MSHRLVGSIVLTDIISLRKAVMKNPDLTWVEGATRFNYNYNAKNGYCSHAIKVKGGHHEHGAFEIGVVQEPDGSGYKLVWESDSRFDAVVGPGACNLNTAYAKEVARDWAAKNGFTVSEKSDTEGNIVLEMTN